MKVRIFLLLACFFFSLTTVDGQKLNNDVDSLSYALGILFGTQIQSAGFQSINAEVFGITANRLVQNETVEMTVEQANNYVNLQYTKAIQTRHSRTLEAGRDFLNKNRNAPGVVSLPSGLQYRIITAGTGPKPSATCRVSVNYHGTFINGTVFDSTRDRGPAEFAVNQVIQGWIEGLQLMPVGSKWMLYIPSELAYGSNPRSGIEPNSTLIFEVELLSINN